MSLALPILDDLPQRPKFAQGPRSLSAVKLLRLSLTDRCNLRCVYCMPDDGVTFYDHADLLSADDIVAVAAAAREAGVTHFKITGGEPTLRKDLVELVRRLAALGPEDLSMTTNGLRLGQRGGQLAHELREAGLDRITVSLDSLDPQTFGKISGDRGFTLEQVWAGINAATQAGFEKLKLNVVVIGGVNDHETPDFAALTLEHPWTVRFIEYMPLGESTLTQSLLGANTFTVDNQQIIQRIEAQHGPLVSVHRDREPGVGPAQVYRLDRPGVVPGRLGFISAMSQPFCETCNRLRLTARGELRACLFDGGEVDLLPTLRSNDDPQPDLIQLMARCVAEKPETHSPRGNRAMSQLGG
ncbi:GTP 3',8-cyclase MoaA [Algisphaera agarilytica]|uniref:GTP 3',8-cyclase n=1 Tax=Algisphaera agarilytica TaxID=1385975 RepID=A0A7X0H834_9BACT|nr:GTP 3',8-cyclase MoaA [Algisphaera agarilytica]MBB6429846.1 cyclic pyranopterin phosphate synthase [Algisphaera agarilytica]